MYSFSPLADNSDSHLGFYFACFLMFCVLYQFAQYAIEQHRNNNGRHWRTASACFWPSVGCLFAAFVLLIVSLVSYNTKPPKNEVVIGKFERFVMEQETRQSGKSTQTYHYTYAEFSVPGGRIALQTNPSYVMPEHVTLYKN